jgi:predicted nucleic acid-binding Zn ribbon protein
MKKERKKEIPQYKKICICCGSEFVAARINANCCSGKCRHKIHIQKKQDKKPIIIKTCLNCNNEFEIKKQFQVFCCRKCQQNYKYKLKKQNAPEQYCILCGKLIKDKRANTKFCNPKCALDFHNKKRNRKNAFGREVRPRMPKIKRIAAELQNVLAVKEHKKAFNKFYERIGFFPIEYNVGAGFKEIKKNNTGE